ncbi:MAG: cupredoxin domain-containing protein [Gammaproteobacteria bacterium]
MRRLFVLLLFPLAAPAFAGPPSYKLDIRDHGFVPTTLTVPADVRIKLEVSNTRSLPSEFESFDLNREKVVPGGSTVTVWIGPLKPGKYKFFDDFNPASIGWIIVAAAKPGAEPKR